MLGDRDAEALEDGARARLEGGAVVRRDAVFELGEPRGVADVLARGELALLGEGARHDLVAGHRHVEDGQRILGGSDLGGARPTRVLVDDDGAIGRGLVPGEDLEERRLARAVGADEPVAGAGDELEGHALEEGARAVGLAEIGDRDHDSATSEAEAKGVSNVSPSIAR